MATLYFKLFLYPNPMLALAANRKLAGAEFLLRFGRVLPSLPSEEPSDPYLLARDGPWCDLSIWRPLLAS